MIIWGLNLAVLLSLLPKKLYRYRRLGFSIDDQIKRIGIYYMCISDILL